MPSPHTNIGERDWQRFIENIEDYAVFMLDLKGHVVAWNRGARKVKGYTPDEIIGKHVSSFYTPEDAAADKPARDLLAVVEHGRVEHEDWRVRKDGTPFWAHVVITALRDDHGELRGFGAVVRDLTERVQQEDVLRRSEERFRLLVESVEDYAIFMLDTRGNIATWNRGAQAIKGYRAEEIIGRHFSQFYPAEDVAAGKPAWELEVAARDGRVEDEGFRVRKDGSLFWASVVITALRGRDGELLGFTKVTRDLSARRAAEEELRRSEERFRLLVESVVDYAMYMLDPAGYVATWNHGAENLKGYSAQEIIGRHFSIFFPEADRLAGKPEKELQIARDLGRFEEEAYRCRKDGSLFWANVVLRPIRDAQGSLVGYAKVTRDLTTRAEAERTARELVREQAARAAAEQAETRIRAAARRAEQAAEQAEEAGRLKDEFLATVSHELRTPLNAIVGWSSLLRTRTQHADLRKGLEVIHRNAVAQGRIIEDILDVSRIITGKLRLDLGATDLTKVVQDAMDVVRPAALAREITLELSVPEGDCRLIADAERLQQVMWNLLSNAVKFGRRHGTIRVVVEGVGSSYCVTVSDDGQGIAPEFLPFVFDRFKQADGSSTRRIGGLGLGLALVRHLVELHGGKVRVSSPGIGQGASFTFTLPIRALVTRLSREPGTSEPARPASVLASRGALAGLRVLVVDDEADARELIATVLASAGAEVRTACSSAEGVATFQQFRPHLLVSDIGMPEEDGYTFIRRIRALGPQDGRHVPALALTAYARNQDRVAAMAAGFTRHIGKPIEPDALLGVMLELAQTLSGELGLPPSSHH